MGTVCQCKPPWEGDQFRTKITRRESPLQAFEVFHLTRYRLSNVWRKLSLNSFYMRQKRAVGIVVFWRACARILGLIPDVSSSRINIL